MDTVNILGVGVSRLGFDATLAACESRIDAGLGGSVIFANVHSVTESLDNPLLRRAMNEAYLVVADGLPLVWTSRLHKEPIGSRVCGPDVMTALLTRRRTERHGFLGGLPGQAQAIATRFGVTPVVHCPPFRPFAPAHVEEDVAAFIDASGAEAPRILWVGLGAPKQEQWMREAARLLPHTLLFGVGAAFDFLSGAKPRAPLWMQQVGLEWAFRLASEPRRLAGRYARTNTRFAWRVLTERRR